MHDAGRYAYEMISMLGCPQHTECFGACCKGKEWSPTHWALLRFLARWWRSGTGVGICTGGGVVGTGYLPNSQDLHLLFLLSFLISPSWVCSLSLPLARRW